MLSANDPQATRATLIGRVRDPSDHQAWHEFDARYRGLLVRFLLSRGLHVADAEEAAQAVLVKLVSGLRTFEYDKAKGGFRAYLFRCARSALADHHSRQVRGGREVSPLHEEMSPASGDAMQAAFEKEWVDHHFRLALERYRHGADDRGRRLLASTLAGVPVSAITEELGMSENGVHKAQQRLRDELRRLVAEQVREEDDGHAG